MSAEVIEMPVSNLDEQEQEEIREVVKQIDNVWGTVRKGAMELGWLGALIEVKSERGAWQVVGFKDQHDFRITRGISRSNWYRHVGVALRFVGHVEKPSYLAMSMENAERLAIEKPELRFNPECLQDAAEMQAKEFSDKLTTLGAHAEGKSVHQQYAEIRLRMEKDRRDRIEDGIKRWCQEQGIDASGDSMAYALEMLVADAADGPSIVGFLLGAIPKMTKAAREAEDLLDLKALLLDFIIEMNNKIHLCYGEEQEDVA